MSRHKREPGLLPRPLAVLGALALTAGTVAVVRQLPQGTAGRWPPAARPPVISSPVVKPLVTGPPTAAFVTFVDTAREPGFDLPAESRRTGVRRYALGHLVAGGDGCAPKWSGPLDPVAGRIGLLDPGRNPVAGRIGRLRALGGDAAPVFGGPGGRELAATCIRPGGLAAAYRRVVGAFDADAVDFEVRDSADRAAVLRRARAIRAMQYERRLGVSFTLRLRSYGLTPGDLAMLRATRQEGAEVGTVNLLAPVESGRLGPVATAVLAARDQIARAQGLADPAQAWRRIALTPVLEGEDDLSETDARKLAAYATYHGLAWLSLRGVTPKPDVSRILWRTPPTG
ncbi:hypothetical protein SAMN05444920_102726 [Nonomuraea solani]|uniref:Chitinase n=1 Tax=Nonomuraea solani TaxID=1144553 RepID=A0A1H5ZKG4_9ACTN|nr:hypothetical protein [Nonomuraea solani]SEG36484.1 hypothetical protein SAMN05444920_102726 [Nonomuraea solani]